MLIALIGIAAASSHVIIHQKAADNGAYVTTDPSKKKMPSTRGAPKNPLINKEDLGCFNQERISKLVLKFRFWKKLVTNLRMYGTHTYTY